jgi:hypothetical protein
VDLARGGRSGAGGEMDKDDVGKKIKKKVKEKNKKIKKGRALWVFIFSSTLHSQEKPFCQTFS